MNWFRKNIKGFSAGLLFGLGLMLTTSLFAAWPSSGARTKEWTSGDTLTDTDLEGQYDVIWTYINDMMNSSSGHTHDGTTGEGPKINVTNLTVGSQALGDLIYASSGSAWTRKAGNTSATKKFLNQTGNGTISAAPSWDALVADDIPVINGTSLPVGSVVQIVNYETGAVATGTTDTIDDDTIPQNTEGDQYMSLAITPTSATNYLKIDVVWNGILGGNNTEGQIALFQDTTANALAAIRSELNTDISEANPYCFTHYMVSGTTSSTTFKVRAGNNSTDTTTFNGVSGARKLGGVMASSITITEIKA